MGEQFIGKWQLVHSDGFDEFLRVIGVSWLTRKTAVSQSPTLEITKSGNSWQFKTESAFKTSVIVFTLGQEFQEERIDGEKVKSTFTLENNILVQKSKGTVDYTVSREVANDVLKTVSSPKAQTVLQLPTFRQTMKAVDKANGKEVTAVRLYKKK